MDTRPCPALPASVSPADEATAVLRADPADAGHAALYQVLLARDARFDGRLYVGVASTGIYCRPICRVRTPRPEHCRFFPSAAQAEAAAYRPCLKCRPELAPAGRPGWTVMDASRTLARQAAALLDAPGADAESASVARLAARLGVSERHLRRIFVAEHGVTPLQYLQTRRLLLAKQLLTDSRLPVAQVALAAGYRSLRRFNAAFAERYRLNPSRLREAGVAAGRRRAARAGSAAEDASAVTGVDPGVEVRLGYRAPLDAARLLAFFAQRAIPGVETVDGLSLRRSLRAGALAPGADGRPASPPGWLEAHFDERAPLVRLRYANALVPHSAALLAAVRRWLDLDAQPAVIDAALAGLPGGPGLRLPGSLDGFELLVRAVLGQQVTVAAARTLACRLVERHGAPLVTPWPDVRRSFPDPDELAALAPEAIAALGIVRTRAAAIVALARDWPTLAPLLRPGADPQTLIERLCALPGLGPWTAHYAAMRALGWPDAFPPGDVAVLKALRGPAGAAAARSPAAERRAAEALSQAWRPWRSYAVLRLWDSLARPDG